MENALTEASLNHGTTCPTELPIELHDWPEEARSAYREVQRELDRWCRTNDWPMISNALVAEEAVRRSWG